MGSISRIVTVHGNRFDGGVVFAGDTAAAPAPGEQKARLPDKVTALLVDLPPKPEERAEWNSLIADRHELNLRTQAYVDRKLAQARADLEAEHERVKEVVRNQIGVVDALKAKIGAAGQEAERAQNALTRVQTELFDATQAFKCLSRFSARKDIEAARQRVEAAEKKIGPAETKVAELRGHVNHLNHIVLVAEMQKLNESIEEEKQVRASITGEAFEFLGIQNPGRA